MSDIVDSTRRWNAAEGAMAADLELHDRLIREVVEGAGGSVFKHTGDGMIAVFDDPVAAAGAAAGIQQAIGGAQWQHPDGLRVRVAVHTGVVYPRDGDLFGTAVNRVARLLGACPPGAVLVSGATTALLADRSPEGLELQRVGPVSLAGFTTPDDASALVGAGLAGVANVAEGRTAGARTTHLPPVEGELVGRTDELATIWDGLGRAPLVTLVGVGGMGKTRLALEVAVGAVAAYNGAVWWIDLATATSADAVLPVAMAAVGARETPGRTILDAITDRFAEVTGLVVVDNCEHVLGAAREMVAALVNGCPALKVVCTSREALGMRREHIVPVGALATGDGEVLFVERALAVRPDLDVDANRAVIERICGRLDRIPLAIELAAARCRSLTPNEIDGRLGDRFRLLRGGRDGAERHRTLQAAVAWSYSLLDPDERTVFDQIAVFAGGALIDALTAVTGFDEFDVIDVVDRLVARSMVVATATPLGTRYHQLETLRHYAEDRLVEAGRIDAARDQHLTWVRGLTEWIGSSTGTSRGGDAFRRFCAEIDNLRVAVAHARNTGRHHIAHEIVAAVGSCTFNRPVFEVFDWVCPVEVSAGWTDAAAVCAAYGAITGWLRGGDLTDGPVGGVPAHYLTDNAAVGALQVSWLSTGFGRWREALAHLDHLPTASVVDRIGASRAWFLVYNARQLFGGPDAELDESECLAIGQLAHETLELARQTGDELLVGSVGWVIAFTVSSHDADAALPVATEAFDIGERLGANTIRDYALAAHHFSLARLAAGNPAHRTTAARGLRAAIREALDSGNFGATASVAGAAFPLIADTDSDAALSLVAAWRRAGSNDVSVFLQRAGIPVPDDWTLWEEQRPLPSFAGAVNRLLAALDRVIAQQSGGDS